MLRHKKIWKNPWLKNQGNWQNSGITNKVKQWARNSLKWNRNSSKKDKKSGQGNGYSWR